jgi:hypothetical protein
MGCGVWAGEPAGQGAADAGSPLKASILDQIKPGEWYEVPNSKVEAVAASKSQFPWLAGSTGIHALAGGWDGGAFDWQRDQLYLGPAGGHLSYNGNEVYAFSLGNMKWRRLTDPDPIANVPGDYAHESTDPKVAPFAMHTYGGLEYLPPPVDRYVVVGGWHTPNTYALNPDKPNHWEVYPGHGTGRTGDVSAYDPVRQLFWFDGPGYQGGILSQWDPLQHQWAVRARGTMGHLDYYTHADIDYKRGLFVAAGGGHVYVSPLNAIPGPITGSVIQTTGDQTIVKSPSPGFCYVPLIDKFVAWNGGADVLTLDMDSKAWTRHAPAATNKIIPGAPNEFGTWGRFRYVASHNVFILYNSVHQNVFFYRLTADKPKVITAVKAAVSTNNLISNIPTAAFSLVEAIYDDGSRRNVTDQASYFSLDPAMAQVGLHGKGVVTGLAGGKARIRVVYTDPALKRGFADTVTLPFKDLVDDSTLEAIRINYKKLALVAGDGFQLEANGVYVQGTNHFTRPCTAQARWESASPDVATVSGGLVKASGKGGTARITAAFHGKTDTAEVFVSDTPVVTRIHFQGSDISPRPGWVTDNGKPYSDARGFGWLDADYAITRDDRSGANILFKSFIGFTDGKSHEFKVKVPEGWYAVRVAMGDHDYPAKPFTTWVDVGRERLLYYTGWQNDVATRLVKAGTNGLVFASNGAVNYLIVAPMGMDMDKYANDGPDK